jgi:hypothetical protein
VEPFKISLKDGTRGIGRRVALKCLQLDQAVREYEEARISFQQSYALKPAPAALRNLAGAELRTGHYLS